MAGNSRVLVVFESGQYRARSSSAESLQLLSVVVGASQLEIKETSGAFDFAASKLTNIAAGTASGHAVEYAQLNTALALYIPLTQKAAANGVATLDSGGKIPVGQLPNSVMEYQGVYDASGNSPSLSDGTGSAGDVYRVSVAGTRNFGSGAITFVVGDYAIYNGSTWEKSHSGADAVTTVNGFAGTVVLTTNDIAESVNLYFTSARAKAAAVADAIVDGVTDVAPSQNAVFDALALKANDNIVVKTVNGQSPTAGAVTLTTSNISEGSNLYFTTARAKAAAVADAIVDGVTDVAPSQNAVFDALALKADASAVAANVSFVNDNAGSITVRQVVYIKSNGHVDLATATLAASSTLVGIVSDASIATTASGYITVNPGVVVSGFSSLTPGAPYYVDPSTAGAITATAPSASGQNVFKVGYALSASTLVYQPQFIINFV